MIYNQAGRKKIIKIAINRLKDSMKNIKIDMTFGNKEGEYIYINMELVLTEKSLASSMQRRANEETIYRNIFTG